MIEATLVLAMLAAAADSGAVCVASRPAASPLDTVELRVATADAGARWRWTATGGQLAPGDTVVRWTFDRAGLGVYQATAEREGDAAVRCSVRVAVVPPSGHMGGTLRARAFLTPERRELVGYAVYSYLLLGARPDSGSHVRYRAAIAEFVRQAEDIDAFHAAQRGARAAFNMNYLPVTRAIGDAHPDSVLRYYDYAAAQALLRRLPADRRGAGPFLVSVPERPLSRHDSLPRRSVVQDLSTVPAPVVGPWVRRFVDVATQQRFDDPSAPRDFLLRLRTAIGVAASGLSDVTSSLAEWHQTWSRLVTVRE